MKMEITVRIKNADGKSEIAPVVEETEIPEFEEFTGPDNFREVFDRCERAVLKIRNQAAELAIEGYLTELSKKKLMRRPENKGERRSGKTGPGTR
jgi:hypothetical protein